MSDVDTKVKRSKRIYSDEVKSKKQLRIAKKLGNPGIDVAHRYHKQHAMNCGNPNCVMCGNPRKFFGDKTIQEQSWEQLKLWNE